jgi:beta-mannosidase
MTVGPWKPVSLQTYQNRIVDLDVRSDVSESLDVKLTADITFSEKAPGLASFVLRTPDGSKEVFLTKTSTDAGHCKVASEWASGELDLWYPVGYGTQPLYTVEVELADEVCVCFHASNAGTQSPPERPSP